MANPVNAQKVANGMIQMAMTHGEKEVYFKDKDGTLHPIQLIEVTTDTNTNKQIIAISSK